MRLKYYLRGLGIGIAVTAVIMSAAMKQQPETLSEEQIKARAAELGMVEDTFLADKAEEIQSRTETETVSEPESETPETVSEPESETPEPEAPETEQSLPEETGSTVVPIPEAIMEITISGGESSVSVSRQLERAGLVASAAEYDRYLCSNGYDKKICTGKHLIKAGATKEEIAGIITSK